jgi:deoxyribodipyrimidine photo-lyase
MKEKVSVVWLKRDLRLSDHAPLFFASRKPYPLLIFYCFEPSLQANYDWDERHWRFVFQSLQDLEEKIQLVWTYEEVIPFLGRIHEQFEVDAIYSHQETGTDVTYERDKLVAKWCRGNALNWKQYQNGGVVRGLRDRTQWQRLWSAYMRKPLFEIKTQELKFPDLSLLRPDHDLPQEIKQDHESFQKGGETEAQKILKDFLDHRHFDYLKSISSPSQGRYSCSRLSPHISWGNISIRTVYQEATRLLNQAPAKKNLLQFISRLQWHCHFIQKFEMEETLEFSNMNKAFDHLRTVTDKEKLKAWEEGRTGYPLVDACMRCVTKTGYLNFRMRAMVVSFLTHHLWQPWQKGASFLARKFLDYEPGIHFPQFQMQSGVTGVNTLRVYNPVKQSKEKDEDALFISEWVPELRHLPGNLIHEPWNITPMEESLYQFKLGVNYPPPVIDAEEAAKMARDRLWKVSKGAMALKENQRILKKHTLRSRNV